MQSHITTAFRTKKKTENSSYLMADYEVWNFINMEKPIQNHRIKGKFYSGLRGNRIRKPEMTTFKEEDSNVCSVSVWINERLNQ